MSQATLHQNSLYSTQKSLENIMKKIHMIDCTVDAFSQFKMESQEKDMWQNMIQDFMQQREQNDEYFSERKFHRYNRYYKQFLNMSDLLELRRLHKVEKTRFKHIADDLVQNLDKTTSNSLKDVNKYFKKSQREEKLLERELFNSTKDSSTAFDNDSTLKNDSLQISLDRLSNQYVRMVKSPRDEVDLSSSGTNSNYLLNYDDFDTFKSSIREKDLKRKEKLRTRAAIHDLKVKRDRDIHQEKDQQKSKLDIQQRLERLRKHQMKLLHAQAKQKDKARKFMKSGLSSPVEPTVHVKNAQTGINVSPPIGEDHEQEESLFKSRLHSTLVENSDPSRKFTAEEVNILMEEIDEYLDS